MFSSSFIVFSNTSSSWVFNMFCPAFFTTCFLSFSPLSSIGFCTISSGFLHFHTFSILILIQEFYLSPSFSDPFCTISSRCYHIFLHFHCIFPACLLYRHGLRLAFAPVSSIFQGIFFPWFVPSIRSVFVRFPGDFVRFPLIVIMFSCSFIVFSNTSSWSLRPPKRRT